MPRRMVALLAALSIAGLPGGGVAFGGIKDDGPQHLSQIGSIGDLLVPGQQRPVHILYVHGISETRPGDSRSFRESICKFLKDCTSDPNAPKVGRDYAESEEFAVDAAPPAYRYMNEPAWKTQEEWRASAPFVDHYVLHRSRGPAIVVDELNWWPMVLPLKCQHLLPDDARLAGPKPDLLEYCAQPTSVDEAHPGRFLHYAWLDPQQVAELEALPAHGARFNRILKANILDWGISDAIMSIGSMQTLFRDAMRQLFVKSATFSSDPTRPHDWQEELANPSPGDREFIVVSHSLGSYLVFSTLGLDQPEGSLSAQGPRRSEEVQRDQAVRYILERTSLLYFFANQIPLLELASMRLPQSAPAGEAAALQPPAAADLPARIGKWQELRRRYAERIGQLGASAPMPAQIVAWSDPSDLLTWRVPGIEGVLVANVYVRNTWWHWLFAGPTGAHDNYATNKDVIRVMLRRSRRQVQ